VALGYQWLRDGVAVAGATSVSYPVSTSDVGHTLAVAVTGSEFGYANATATSAATIAVAAPPAPPVVPTPWPTANGAFVRVVESGEVYHIAGGAPLYISSFAPFGGPQPTQSITASHLATLRAVPANGTYLRDLDNGRVYSVDFGAPIYVAGWASVGGAQPTIGVTDSTIANAGVAGRWSHLLAVPTDGFLRDVVSGAVYRVASGHPYYVPSWAPYGGAQPWANASGASIASCDHLNCTPWGSLDAVTVGAGAVSVSGWVQDPNTQSPVTVQVTVDNVVAGTTSANSTRADVDSIYHFGTQHGYSASVTAAVGTHTVCVTGVNIGAGTGNTQLGCQTVKVVTKG
jgi:hypothetical protein